jgi:hypothetical protein
MAIVNSMEKVAQRAESVTLQNGFDVKMVSAFASKPTLRKPAKQTCTMRNLRNDALGRVGQIARKNFIHSTTKTPTSFTCEEPQRIIGDMAMGLCAVGPTLSVSSMELLTSASADRIITRLMMGNVTN